MNQDELEFMHEIRKEMETLYWRGIHTAFQAMSRKTPEERNRIFENLGHLAFEDFKREVQDFVEWKNTGGLPQ